MFEYAWFDQRVGLEFVWFVGVRQKPPPEFERGVASGVSRPGVWGSRRPLGWRPSVNVRSSRRLSLLERFSAWSPGGGSSRSTLRVNPLLGQETANVPCSGTVDQNGLRLPARNLRFRRPVMTEGGNETSNFAQGGR